MIVRRVQTWILVAVPLLLVVAVVGPGCSSKSSGAQLAGSCTLNSDCANPLVCIFGLCHQACVQSRDCSDGERCVDVNGSGVCELPSETSCAGGKSCSGTLVCAYDSQCRAPCQKSTDCLTGQLCVQSACFDPTEVDGGGSSSGGTSSSGGSSSGGTSSSGGAGEGGAGEGGNSCPTAQTQFAITAQGDTNPSFIDGSGARTAKHVFIFEGYMGPDVQGDSGGNAEYVYSQAFDVTTGNSLGAAAPLIRVGTSPQPIYVENVAVAPTGEILVAYDIQSTGAYAAFLTEDANGALTVVKNIQISTEQVTYDYIQAVWSNAAQAFLVSYKYDSGGGRPIRVQKFLPNGSNAGGGTDPVPTDLGTAQNADRSVTGIAGVSNGTYGVPWAEYNTNLPYLTALDANGSQVGPVFQVASNQINWAMVAGTKAGFVYVYDLAGNGTAEVLIPVASDGGVTATPDGGTPSYTGFQVPGTKQAVYGAIVADDQGGAGGVGVGLIYADGVSFAYVNADGVTHVGPTNLIAHTYATGDGLNVATFGGSFAVTLSSVASHSSQVMISGCH